MKSPNLLSRDDFRESTFRRDLHKCIICGQPAQDAHHIIERRLFPDGGYYLDNGASLCQKHHLDAELTTISCAEIRAAAQIQQIILPPQFQPQLDYDKWGNPILADGQRARGQLFASEPVQKTIQQARLYPIFTKYIHHPILGFAPDFVPNFPVLAAILPVGQFVAIYDNAAYLNDFQLFELPPDLQICQSLLDEDMHLWGLHTGETFYLLEVWQGLTSLAWREVLSYAQMLQLPTLPPHYQGDQLPKETHNQWIRSLDSYDLADYASQAAHQKF